MNFYQAHNHTFYSLNNLYKCNSRYIRYFSCNYEYKIHGKALTIKVVQKSILTKMATQEIELIIKASAIDDKRKGGCLFCQEYFMELYLMAELQTIALRITLVDMLKPPEDFRSKFGTSPPPILIDGHTAAIDNENIEEHIKTKIPGAHNLYTQPKEVITLIQDVYSKFKVLLLRKDDGARKSLLAQLLKINNHLESNGGSRFLSGDTMCSSDCELMPKLQHIRIAGAFFVDFYIPLELKGLWRYIVEMYHLPAFIQSCPYDQDIINHYRQQKGLPITRQEKLEIPILTKTIPSEANL